MDYALFYELFGFNDLVNDLIHGQGFARAINLIAQHTTFTGICPGITMIPDPLLKLSHGFKGDVWANFCSRLFRNHPLIYIMQYALDGL